MKNLKKYIQVLAIGQPVWKNDSEKYAKDLGEYLMEARLTILSVLDNMNFDKNKFCSEEQKKEMADAIENINHVENELKAWVI